MCACAIESRKVRRQTKRGSKRFRNFKLRNTFGALTLVWGAVGFRCDSRALFACSSKLPGSGCAAVASALLRWEAAMRQFRHISLMLAALFVCQTVGDDSWAKGGRGGSKGGSEAQAPKNVDKLTAKSKDPRAVADFQSRLEKWKLKMRLEAIERLREKAGRTGNDKLRERADVLEKWARERFEQRMNEIMEYRRRHGLPDIIPHAAPGSTNP
jgi:hypothetical protein